jgi:peptidyl-dipeptidase Dcp
MTRVLLPLLAIALLFGGCARQPTEETVATRENPLLSEFDTPLGAPPFDSIEVAHYLPAFEQGMEEHMAEVLAIAESSDAATFENTVEALERSGETLSRTAGVFFRLSSSTTNDEMQAIARNVSPKLAKHRDDIYLNRALFAQVKAVYDQRETLELTTEQAKLLDETYKAFVRGGANLEDVAAARFREINEELSLLTIRFDENLLKEMNSIALLIEDEADLAGLPQSVVDSAAATAAAQGEEGKWAFTLQRTSWTPFLESSERRDLREELYTAYMNLGNNDNEYDNKALASRIAALRAERANLLGYETFAAYVLEENMAETADNVYGLLDRLWLPALARAKAERADLQAMIDKEGGDFPVEPWDWWYYSEKVRAEQYAFDSEQIKPYFVLDNVRQAAFDVANKLFGITFEPRADVPVYHPDVQAYEVKDTDGSTLALYYVDYFARESKQGGAWMNAFREQRKEGGEDVRPIIVNVCNFSKPSAGQPALLSLDEAKTLFHEFGHALHGMVANGSYASLSGTNVPRDFVELPSQMMENWALAPEVLPTYARHYETGEPIPAELIEKLQQSKQFNQGFETTEYVSASLLDMDWHTLDEPVEKDPMDFEAAVEGRLGMIPEIAFRYRTPYFSHIFAGGYPAGYYGYVWAEVLDADAFELFEEKGLFNQEVAKSYRENILEPGGSENPMEMYVRFRGSEPSVEPLIERRGLGGE